MKDENMNLDPIKAKKRMYNENQTKKQILKNIYEIEEKGKLIIEGDKQRVNITINGGLWKRFGDKVGSKEKSQIVEKLIKKYLEENEEIEIILRKPII